MEELEEEVQLKRLTKKQIERQENINKIRSTAFIAGPNFVSKELTYQQGLSIFLRSKQLAQAGQKEYEEYQEQKKKEMNWCWNSRR